MFHKDVDTLDLLEKYSKKQEPIKTEKIIIKPKIEKVVYRTVGKIENRNIETSNFKEYEYASFLDRAVATILDSIIIYLPLMVIGSSFIFKTGNIFLTSFMFEYIIPIIISILFWINKGATPGKLIMNMYIVDRKSGNRIEFIQAIIRYLGYFPSILIFGLGIIWVAIDEKNQGWHDKIADTIVIRKKRNKEVQFN